MQIEVVEARGDNGSAGYYFVQKDVDYKLGEKLIVEAEHGKVMVELSRLPFETEAEALSSPPRNIIGKATEKDKAIAKNNQERAKSMLPEVRNLAREENLEIKIIGIEPNLSFNFLTVYFTAENRVDFRSLVRKLSEKFRCRISMRQVSPRDAARMLGGIGPCGKECCCRQGVSCNDRVSIKMAKNQGISINPSAISGLCGKLLCCIAFENETYSELLKIMPKVGSVVESPDGEGKVVYCNLLKKEVDVRLSSATSAEVKTYPLSKLSF